MPTVESTASRGPPQWVNNTFWSPTKMLPCSVSDGFNDTILKLNTNYAKTFYYLVVDGCGALADVGGGTRELHGDHLA